MLTGCRDDQHNLLETIVVHGTPPPMHQPYWTDSILRIYIGLLHGQKLKSESQAAVDNGSNHIPNNSRGSRGWIGSCRSVIPSYFRSIPAWMKDRREKRPKDKTRQERGLGRAAIGGAGCCCGWEPRRLKETYGSDGLIRFSCGEEERH